MNWFIKDNKKVLTKLLNTKGRMEVAMEGILIKLDTFEKIRRFIDITGSLDYDIDLISGRYVVDGKSIMGIFSLELSKPIEVHVLNYRDIYPKELEEFMIYAA
jgi:hypothetical protein